MNKIITILAAFLFLSSGAYAGFKELTWHSRANCGNNESITWHFGHNYELFTISNHLPPRGGLHQLYSHNSVDGRPQYEITWRSAAVHWGEAVPGSGWVVGGRHYIIQNRKERLLGTTDVVDCSIYNGWWDR